jgi:hypothetical protein
MNWNFIAAASGNDIIYSIRAIEPRKLNMASVLEACVATTKNPY